MSTEKACVCDGEKKKLFVEKTKKKNDKIM